MTDIIQASRELAETIAAELQQCSALVREGKKEEFRKSFLSLLDKTHNFVGLIAALEKSREQGLRFQPLADALQERTREILLVNSSGNMQLLADIMQYELVPLFESWPGVVRAVLN